MAYQNIPRFEPNYGNKYGFRPRPAPTLGPPGASSAPAQLASESQTRLNDYSGTSAEDTSGPNQSIDDNNDSNTGPGTRLDGSVPETNAPPSYASPTEAAQYGLAGYNNNYFGTVQDAAAANRTGNLNARGTLQDFVASGPTGTVKAPGTLGFLGGLAADAAAGEQNRQDRRNITDSLRSLSDSGDLYNNDNSSGYFGNTLNAQQTVSDVDATNTFGTFNTAPTVQQQTGPEVFHSLTPDPVAQVQEQQANYDFYQDNSSDDNSGQTDGTQTGGETSHAGGYGGFADDTAATNSDSGGGGGGK